MRFALALLITLATACGDDGHEHPHADAAQTVDASPPPDAAPTSVFTQQYSFAEGIFAEPLLTMGQDAWAAITVTSTGGDAYWNIHYHDGSTVTLYESDTSSEQYSFVPPASRDYYFLVGNRAVDATIEVDVRIAIFGTGSVNE